MNSTKRIFFLFAMLLMSFEGAYSESYPPPRDYFYLTPPNIGTRWTYVTEWDTTQHYYGRRTFIDVTDTTTFGVPGETLSYKVEWSETFVGSPDTSTYRILYYTYNSGGDLCVSAAEMESLVILDPLWIYLRNPITVGDSTHYGFGGAGYEVSAVVVSNTDTLDLPVGHFSNCLHIRERSWFNGQPQEVNDIYYIPTPWPFAGIGKQEGTHWDSYPTSSRFGRSYLIESVPTGMRSQSMDKGISFALHQNYPNPFNPVTVISFTLPEPMHTRLSIHNPEGKHIRTLLDDYVSGGYRQIIWDGLDSQGNPVASGVYFYRLKAGDEVQARKMVVVQ